MLPDIRRDRAQRKTERAPARLSGDGPRKRAPGPRRFRPPGPSQQLLDLLGDLVGIGEAAGGVLAVDLLASGEHVEDAAVAAMEVDRQLVAEAPRQLGRQTGGPWVVVSADAVVHVDLHGAPILRRAAAPRQRNYRLSLRGGPAGGVSGAVGGAASGEVMPGTA